MIILPDNLSFPGAIDPSVQMQQAGFDLTMQNVEALKGNSMLDFDNSERQLPETTEVEWMDDNAILDPGAFLVTYNEEITVPGEAAGLVLPRSSLMRCGASLHTALWDPGYRGRGQGLLVVYPRLFGSFMLKRNARIGQFVLIRLESRATSTYSGVYQGENL